MPIRRIATYSLAAVALGALISAPTALAASRQPARPVPVTSTVGHIAYVTQDQAVDIATVDSSGTTSAVTSVGPVTMVTAGQKIQVFDLIASGDGAWIAWDEQVVSHHPLKFKDVLVLRRESSGTIYHLVTSQAPLGFANDQLVTSSGDSTKRLDLQPTAHLVKVKDSQFPMAAYPKGVVDAINSLKPAGPKQTWRLRLTAFAGGETVLHNYVLGPTDYRLPDLAWVSGDAKHMVVELGNHQDFGGLGPSSLADEYALSGSHKRTKLSHYGTNGAHWRVGAVSFAGASDSVWAMWERATTTGATSVVAHHEFGTWAPITNHGIAVAGNSAGYVISQPGKWVVVNKDTDEMAGVPTGNALLIHGSTTVSLDAEGSAFVWVAT